VTDLAALWHSHGKNADALELLVPVHDWFREGDDTHDIRRARDIRAAIAGGADTEPPAVSTGQS